MRWTGIGWRTRSKSGEIEIPTGRDRQGAVTICSLASLNGLSGRASAVAAARCLTVAARFRPHLACAGHSARLMAGARSLTVAARLGLAARRKRISGFHRRHAAARTMAAALARL